MFRNSSKRNAARGDILFFGRICSRVVRGIGSSVSAEILKYEIKTITLSMSDAVSTPGKNPREYTYEFSQNQFNVQIKGKANDLANLSVSSLGPEINLTDKGVGEYVLPLEFKSIDSTKYTIIGEYTCSVKIAEKIEATPNVTPTPTPENTATVTP